MKNKLSQMHQEYETKEALIAGKPNRAMSERYSLAAPAQSFMPKKPQTPAQHASVKKAAAASVAKRRGLMPLTFKPTKGAF